MLNERLSVCVASPDAYADVLKTYLDGYRRFCADWPYPLILSTQNGQYDGFTALCSHDLADNWTLRMLAAAKHCTSKYILLMCDDIIFFQKPDWEAVEGILDDMDAYGLVFCGLTNFLGGKKLHDGSMLVRPRVTRAYDKNLQCGIFDREYLLQQLGDGSLSPWDIEAKWLTEKPEGHVYCEKIVSCRQNILHCVHGVVKGKWFPSALRKLEKAGISVDGNRPRLTRAAEMRMQLTGAVGKLLGRDARKRVKRILTKFGFRFTTKY